MTEQTKIQIAKDYADKTNKTKDLALKYHISPSQLTKIVLEQGGQLRQPRRSKLIVKKCSKCYKTTEIKGAKFCPYCGTDIRSEKDLLTEKINNLLSLLMLLPNNCRDEAQTTLNEMKTYINKN